MKQINILLPCVDDSQRRYASKVQLQYDEPIYNQVLGRLIMDVIYAPVNSKITAVARPNGQPRQAGVARGVRGHALPPSPRNFEL